MPRSSEPTGAERVAAFLLTLDKGAAAEVLKHLDENVIVEVVEALKRLDAAHQSPETERELYRELIGALRKPTGARLKSESELKNLLRTTLGAEQAGKVWDKIHQRVLQERPFLSIEAHPAKNIALALAEESDAVAALVLAHVDPALCAEVLGCMEPERSLATVRRMAGLVPPGFQELVRIAGQLTARLGEIATGPVPAEPARRLRTIAEVLNLSKPVVGQHVLGGIAKEDAGMAAEIREYMFTFEDLADLDKKAMQKVLSSVDMRTLSISLKGAPKAVEENVMANLSQRVRGMVAEERELTGPMAMSEVLVMRGELMKAVRSLLESGEIAGQRSGDELVT
jgi:flagellar motor switch protein FliG